MIKAVLLDVDNTLLDFDKGARKIILRLAEQDGIVLPENFWPVFDAVNLDLWGRKARGEMTEAELFQVRYPEIFRQTGIPYDGLEFERQFLAEIRYSDETMEGAKELLQELHGQYIVGVATNSNYEQQRERLIRSGLYPYIDLMFVSDRIGYDKPDPRFFDAVKEKLMLLREDEILMVGDTIAIDIVGGRNAGFYTCWLNYYGRPLPEDRPCDYVIGSLPELRRILEYDRA